MHNIKYIYIYIYGYDWFFMYNDLHHYKKSLNKNHHEFSHGNFEKLKKSNEKSPFSQGFRKKSPRKMGALIASDTSPPGETRGGRPGVGATGGALAGAPGRPSRFSWKNIGKTWEFYGKSWKIR